MRWKFNKPTIDEEEVMKQVRTADYNDVVDVAVYRIYGDVQRALSYDIMFCNWTVVVKAVQYIEQKHIGNYSTIEFWASQIVD